MKMRIFSIAIPLLGFCLVSKVTGSAIPIWEYLSKNEKMSHLYKIFSQQVEKHCSRSSMPDCHKNFLITGKQNLASISDDRLDLLDPYQRNSEDMIWQALAGSSNRNEQDFEDHYSRTPPVYSENDNVLAEESAPIADYVRPANHQGPFLMGPMVFRVMPDGRPVPGDRVGPLPKDEDIEDLRFPRLPSIEEIESITNSRYYQKSKQHSNNELVSPFHDRRLRPTYGFIVRNRRNNYALKDPIFSAIPFDLRYY